MNYFGSTQSSPKRFMAICNTFAEISNERFDELLLLEIFLNQTIKLLWIPVREYVN